MLRLLQIEQCDEDSRGTRVAPPDDIRHELSEATILVVHPIGQSNKSRARFFSGFESESVGSHIRRRVDDVICDGDVSRVV